MFYEAKQEGFSTLIESAMSRLEGRSPDSVAAADRKEQERQDLGRRDYDQALAKRLEQLRGALGTNKPVMPPTSRPAAAPRPLPQPAAQLAPATQIRGFGIGSLLITALLFAALGAGAMWLAVGANPSPAQPQVEVASAPPRAAPVAVEPVQATASAPVAAPAPTAVAEPASVAPPLASDEEGVSELIEDWRSAWSDRDVEAYLACYSPDFAPANGQTHDAWVAARRENIATRRFIVVKTNDLKLERLDARRMKASFLQDYESGSYRETATPKTLLLVRNEAGWEIAGEWEGNAPASALAKP